MTPFQIVFTLVGLSIATYQIARGILDPAHRPARLLFMVVLTTSVAAVLKPEWVQTAADLLSIGRGADFVLYLFVIVSILCFFFFYRKHRILHEQMTILARRLTLLEGDRRVHFPQDKLNDPVGPQTGEPAQSDK